MFRFILVVVAVIGLGGSYTSAQAVRPDVPSSDEYRVYNAVISDMFAGRKMTFDTGADVELLVIREETVRDTSEQSRLKYVQERLSISDELLNNYKKVSGREDPLKREFTIDFKYVLVSKKKLWPVFDIKQTVDIFPGAEDWTVFYNRYPRSGGFNSLSRVGFDKDRTHALVYFENWCRSACGTGHFLLLQKIGNEWKVSDKFNSWIS